METVKEQIAYLRGMIDGGEAVKDESTRGILRRIMQVLDDMAEDIQDISSEQEAMADYLEAIDDDLSELEEVYVDDHDDFDDDEEEDPAVEMDCPHCHRTVYFDEDFLYDDDVEVTCPDCGDVVYDSKDLDAEVEEITEGRSDEARPSRDS